MNQERIARLAATCNDLYGVLYGNRIDPDAPYVETASLVGKRIAWEDQDGAIHDGGIVTDVRTKGDKTTITAMRYPEEQGYGHPI